MTEPEPLPAQTPADVTPEAARFGIERLAFAAATVIVIGLMLVALFLPWTAVKGTDQGLAEYGAPTPAVVAWVLLAFGLAICVVAGGSFVLGSARSLPAVALGGLIYGAGALVWFVSTVLPAIVGSGCVTNPGTLCEASPGNPIAPNVPTSGFALAVAAAVVAVGLGAFALARQFTSDASQSAE